MPVYAQVDVREREKGGGELVSAVGEEGGGRRGVERGLYFETPGAALDGFVGWFFREVSFFFTLR